MLYIRKWQTNETGTIDTPELEIEKNGTVGTDSIVGQVHVYCVVEECVAVEYRVRRPVATIIVCDSMVVSCPLDQRG